MENFPLCSHQEFEVQFIKHGQGFYFIRNHNYLFQKNSLIVIPPHILHALTPRQGVHIEKIRLMFQSSILKQDQQLAAFPKGFPYHINLLENDASDLETVFHRIHKELTGRRKYYKDVVGNDIKNLLLLAKRIGLQDTPAQKVNPLVSQIVDYIDNSFMENITVISLAEKFSLSPNYLSWLFKDCTGINLKQYILHRRIAEAKRLLEEDRSVKPSLVYAKVGFQQFATFNRSFKQITGFTPAVYRRISYQDKEN
ncbi:MAG: AraC family transcriptional regulator [bacterium]|nr:AraC family transcriptional regulator [bacterium]